MAANPVAAYRRQNNVKLAGSYDPVVVAWDKQAAAATGADPVALLATALQESGAQRGRVGDKGTSFGPWQFHVGGALGSHSPAWANTYAAALNRAQEFARYKVHGGAGAAAVQRPADRALYAQGVESLLARARAILGSSSPVPMSAAPASVKSIASTTPVDALSAQGRMAFIQAILNDAPASDLIGLVQQAGGQGGQPPAVPTVVSPPEAAAHNAFGRVVALSKPKIIGEPYQGTHTLGNWESDNAIDIAMPVGTPIYATTSGTIGSQIGSLGSGGRFAGLRVHLDGAGQSFYYAHLSKLAVKAGQKVQKGQLIGYSGSANGVAHLHLATKTGNPRVFA